MPNHAHLLMLDKDQVELLLEPAATLEAVKEAFLLHSQQQGRVFPVVREALSTGGVFGIKSGDVQSQGLLGFKAAGFWPSNTALGGERHQATIMLIDPATGRPLCMIDGNAVTTMRTGAAGALGISLLARQDSQSVCVFGTGVPARIQLEYALSMLPSLLEVRYVTNSGQPDVGFEGCFTGGCVLTHVVDRNAAVAASDIVITTTPGRTVLFDLEAVRPGTHINCVGTDTRGKRELPEGLLARSHLFVDDRVQAGQIGETQWAPETPCVEIGDLLTGNAPFLRERDDITVFDMTGLALQDLTTARLLHRRASAAQVGTKLAWPW